MEPCRGREIRKSSAANLDSDEASLESYLDSDRLSLCSFESVYGMRVRWTLYPLKGRVCVCVCVCVCEWYLLQVK